MQFIEKSAYSVRSAIYRLRKGDSGLEFILFPMVHAGSEQFYEAVGQRLEECDLILIEGVTSKRGALLTLSYRIVKQIRRMDLVLQRDALQIARFRHKLVRADMAGPVFDERWGALPLSLRAQIVLFVPAYVIYLFFFGTRETIARHIALEDLPSRKEALFHDENVAKLDALLLDERDQLLIRAIEELYTANHDDRRLVGVVYGAEHMRSAMRFLRDKLRYQVATAEWITVFDL